MTVGGMITVGIWAFAIAWLVRQAVLIRREERDAANRRILEVLRAEDHHADYVGEHARVFEFPVRPTRNGKDAA